MSEFLVVLFIIKIYISNLLDTTRFWPNFRQVHSTSHMTGQTNNCFWLKSSGGEKENKGPKQDNRLLGYQGYKCLREMNLIFCITVSGEAHKDSNILVICFSGIINKFCVHVYLLFYRPIIRPTSIISIHFEVKCKIFYLNISYTIILRQHRYIFPVSAYF